ncbi:beta-galactosidase [Rossellomorea marisflavi]|uniref:beta-galactosidase n=1 Tax=Rossellomorea marisflavi TaxID=189381 RepID=UPI0035141D06
MVQIKEQKVIIDGQEVFLFGGELHYFRIPRGEWRDRIRKLKEAGGNLVSTYIPWTFHEMEEGKIDLIGETRPERDLPAFLELVQEEGMVCLVRPGPYVMAEIVDHGVPTWLIDDYPEAVAKTRDGENHPTRVVSYMHPVFLEKAERWYEAVCRILAPYQATLGGPVIMFQLDNEVGMFHWVTNQGDYNEKTLSLFKGYLERAYTDERFKEVYATTKGIGEFALGLRNEVEENHAHALHNDLSLFMREHYRSFIEHLKASAEAKGIEVPFVVNIHGFHTVDLLKRGTMYPIGISQLLEAAKIENVVVAGDYYIGNIEYDTYIDIVLANAFTKAIQWKEQPLFSAEFQGGSISDKPRLQPSAFDLTTRLCVGDGMNALNYYMFAGGVNEEGIGLFGKWHEWQAPLSSRGEERPHYYTIQHLGKMIRVFGRQLILTRQQVDTHLGFNPDYFMTEFKDAFTGRKVDEIQRLREGSLFNGMAKGLRHANVNFDAINLLDEGPISTDEIPVLWMFATKWMDEAIQRKLVRYVEDGGTLILFPAMPEKTMKNEPCTVLKDFIGVDVMSTGGQGFYRTEEMDDLSTTYMESYRIDHGAFAWNEDGSPVAFKKPCGSGNVIMFGADLELDFGHKLGVVRDLARKAGVTGSWRLDAEVDAAMRAAEDGSRFVFLHNFDEYVKETPVHYKGVDLFDGKTVSVPAKGGLMLPVEVPLAEDLMIVYGTGEIFDYERLDDAITLHVQMPVPTVEFVFESGTWAPVECDGVTISRIGEEGHHVTIRTHDAVAGIAFRRIHL